MLENAAATDLLTLAKGGFSNEVLSLYKEQSEKSLYFFAKAVCGYREMVVDPHRVLTDWLQSTSNVPMRGILMPRMHFKSTIVKAYVLWRILQNPNIRVLFVGENDEVGAKNMSDIKWHFESNTLVRALWPGVIPADFGKTKWTESKILVNRSRSFDEPTVTAVGIGAKHTGFHYDIIVYDDPVGLEAAQSPADMTRAIEWFKAATGLRNSPETQEIVVGTRWKDGAADLYGWIMENLPFQSTDLSGCLWHIRSIIEDGKPIFPERFPLDEIERIRKRTKEYLFAANYMNDPTMPGSADFDADWIRTYQVDEKSPSFAILDDGQRVSLPSLVRVSVYDPSSGGRMADSENAIVVAGQDSKGRILVIDAWSANCGFGEAIDQWRKMNDRWKCWQNWFEGIGAHKEVEEVARMSDSGSAECPFCKKRHTPLRPKRIEMGGMSGRSKEDRIRSLAQPAFEERRVYLRLGMEKLRRQVSSFPHGAKVDLFDALAYAIHHLRRPSSPDELESAQKDRQRRLAMSAPRTHTGTDYGGYV